MTFFLDIHHMFYLGPDGCHVRRDGKGWNLPVIVVSCTTYTLYLVPCTILAFHMIPRLPDWGREMPCAL